MPRKRCSHAEIVEALGGMTALGQALGLNPMAVAQWKQPDRGIPPWYWPRIERLAAKQGRRITVRDLEETHPKANRGRAA